MIVTNTGESTKRERETREQSWIDRTACKPTFLLEREGGLYTLRVSEMIRV